MKIKYTHEIKAETLPINLKAKTANNHLLSLQSNATKENAFYIISVSIDLFDRSVPVVYFNDEYNKHNSGQLRDLFFNRITKGHYPNLMFILSAVDPQSISKCIPDGWIDQPPANIMYDLRIQDQLGAESLVPQYLKIKGNKTISLFCQSSEISLLPWLQTGKLDSVTQTAKSMQTLNINWVRKIRSECLLSNTPYAPDVLTNRYQLSGELLIRQHPDGIFHSAYAICNTPEKRKPQMKGIPFEDFFGKV